MKFFSLTILIALLFTACTEPEDAVKKYFTDNRASFDAMATLLLAENDSVADNTLTLYTEDITNPTLKAAMGKINLYNVSLSEEDCATPNTYDAVYVQMQGDLAGGYSYYYIYTVCPVAQAFVESKRTRFVQLTPNWVYLIEKGPSNGFN